ncbi:hypothetical protein M8J75_013285 [Diaphorina citri]|nr:hypothetical protein M8J75_013285 [Diaphorina citri]
MYVSSLPANSSNLVRSGDHAPLSCYQCDSSTSAHCLTISNQTKLIQCVPFSYCMKTEIRISTTVHVKRDCLPKSSQFGAALKSHCVVLTDVAMCLCEQNACNQKHLRQHSSGYVLLASVLVSLWLKT